MSSPSATDRAHATTLSPVSFDRLAGVSAMLAGAAGFLYALAFVILQIDLLSALFLLLGGLLATPALLAVYSRLRAADEWFALLAVLLLVVGAFGAVIHGGYDLANTVHRPAAVPDVANPVDPRGLLTFGVSGLGMLLLAWIMGRGLQFPRELSQLGFALGVLLVALYLSRLIILDAKNPLVVVLAVLTGFLANPLWYLRLGIQLKSAKTSTSGR